MIPVHNLGRYPDSFPKIDSNAGGHWEWTAEPFCNGTSGNRTCILLSTTIQPFSYPLQTKISLLKYGGRMLRRMELRRIFSSEDTVCLNYMKMLCVG